MDPGRLLVRQPGQNNKLSICETTCLRGMRCRATEEDISGICAQAQAYQVAYSDAFTTYTPHIQHTQLKLSIVWVQRPLTYALYLCSQLLKAIVSVR